MKTNPEEDRDREAGNISGESSLYGIRPDGETRSELSEEMRLWQMPKEGMIQPPSEPDAAGYAMQEGKGDQEPVSEEVRRWQMPKEGQMNGPADDTDLYGTADREEPPSEEARRWQMNASAMFEAGDSGDKGAYDLRTGSEPVPSGPDMPVLFADAKYDDSEVYGLTPAADAVPKKIPKREPIPAAEPDEHPEEAADIYGVTEAGKQFYASDIKNPGRTYEDPDEAYRGIAGKGAFEGEVSIDTIYGRRAEQARTGVFAPKEPEAAEPMLEKSNLPKYPYFTRILCPFFSPSFVLRLLMLSVAALVPFYVGIWYFSRNTEKLNEFANSLMVGEAVQKDEAGLVEYALTRPKMEKFLACLYEDRLFLFFVSWVWGVFAVPYFLQVFTATAAGDDRISEWPEMSMGNGIAQFLWLMLLVFCAGIPGWLLMKPFQLSEAGFVAGTIFLTPIFFLASMEKDSYFTLMTRNVFRSLKKVWKYWRRFYLLSIFLFFIGGGGFCAILWEVVWDDQDLFNVVTAAIAASILFSILPVLYLRFLGRLAWVIQDRMALPLSVKEGSRSGNHESEESEEKSRKMDPYSFSQTPEPVNPLRHLAMIPEEPEKKETKPKSRIFQKWHSPSDE